MQSVIDVLDAEAIVLSREFVDGFVAMVHVLV